MKQTSTSFYVISIIFSVGFLAILSACQKETTEPQPVDNSITGKYTGEMVTKYATATQATSQTMAVGVEIKTGAKAGELTWVITAPLGEYNDPATATVTTSGSSSILSIPKQQQTYSPGQQVTYEGSGRIEGKKLTMSLKEEDTSGKYDHQITATKP
jgi:hypothetical protein